MPGMWNEIEKIYLEEGIQIGDSDVFQWQSYAHEFNPDKAESFFVGDAAGRQYTKSNADFASTDRKWAQNIGLTFWTPEVRTQFLDIRLFFLLIFVERNSSLNFLGMKFTRCLASMSHHCQIVRTLLRNLSKIFYLESEQCHL